MIQTDLYTLRKSDYFKLLLLLQLKKIWWILLISLTVSVVKMPDFGKDTMSTCLALYGIFYTIVVLFSLIRWVNSKENKNIYAAKRLIFSSDKITALSGQDSVFATPTTNEFANDEIIKKDQLLNFYLLYIAKGQFIVVPKNIFLSKEDQLAFEKLFKFN